MYLCFANLVVSNIAAASSCYVAAVVGVNSVCDG